MDGWMDRESKSPLNSDLSRTNPLESRSAVSASSAVAYAHRPGTCNDITMTSFHTKEDCPVCVCV